MKKIVLLTGVISGILLILFMLSFRSFRLFFLPPEISEHKIVGYSQYYGYPYYYDTIVFFILIFLPSFIFIILWYIRKK